MIARGSALVVGLVVVTGCVGHLEFDPLADGGAGTTPPANNGGGTSGGTSNNNNTVSAGSGGWAGSQGNQGSTGTGGQASASGTGSTTGSGGNGAAPDAGGAGYPTADGGGTIGTDSGSAIGEAGTAAAVACPTGVNVLTDIFSNRCGGCHGAAAPTKNLDLVSTGLGARMVNKTSTCKSQPLVAGLLTSGKPTGLLFQKLAGAVTDCGVQMPAGGTPLTAAEIACVSDWAVTAIAKVSGGK
ncbi:MAG TPA: hypothetical protein VH374_17220 [Polyangia bacterium]|jgi:hypothetical protein|nr:hypothetical protein [Polyangia bacterium]